MYHQKKSSDYTIKKVRHFRPQFLGNIARWHLISLYMGSQFRGESYQVTNRSKHIIHLNESQFYRPHVRAIALEKSMLLPNQTIRLFKVVDNNG
jgi:hypothetical protein